MNTRFNPRMSWLMGSLLLSLSLGELFSGWVPFIQEDLYSATAQAQPVPDTPESQVKLLTPDEFAQLGLSAQLEAFIPEELAALGISTHPRDTRGTIGEDDRMELVSRRYPWSAIGRIAMTNADGTGGICSGTLIATDLVLTNAHCVMSEETGELFHSIQFQPNVVNNAVVDLADLANVEAVFLMTTPEALANPPDANDWAILKLDQPLGDRYGTIPWMPLPVERLVEDFEASVTLVGYSGDYPRERPSSSAGVHLGCSILGVYEENLLHDCDSFGGSSGGPILAWIDDQPYIVGVNSAEATNPEVVIGRLTNADGSEQPIYQGIVNFGVHLPRIIEVVEQNSSEKAN